MIPDFSQPLADARDFPEPELSMLPHIKGEREIAGRPLIVNAKVSLPISYARNGLGIIAKALLSPGCKVLIPAYHCPALVEPFIWAQCDIDFYPLTKDLSPDMDVLEQKLPSAVAIVLVPFFGFEENVVRLVELARKSECIPIEDLAHAAHANTLHGDYGVTSLQKFYPVATGGELLIAGSVNDSRVADQWLSYQLNSWQWKVRQLKGIALSRLSLKNSFKQHYRDIYRYFIPDSIGEPVARADVRQLTRHDHRKIAATRRSNYQKMDVYLRQSKLGQPLFYRLGADDVPYVYPFILGRAEYFDLIRNTAIPLYRWEEISPSGCETSNSYRSRLIQFPCHQDLECGDIERIIAKLAAIESTIR